MSDLDARVPESQGAALQADGALRLVHRPCLLCGTDTASVLVCGRDRLRGSTQDFRVVRCAHCHLARTDPRPDTLSLARTYPIDYEPHAPAPRRSLVEWMRSPRYRLRLRVLRSLFGYVELPVKPLPRWLEPVFGFLHPEPPFRLLPWRGQGRLLDVGCGAGAQVARLNAFGWQARGIDTSETAVARATSAALPVARMTLADLARDERFDVISFASVLEHLEDPLAALVEARDRLAADGRIVLRVPNLAGLTFQWFQTNWFPLELPRHLFHFTPTTLTRLAQRAELAVERISMQSGPRGILRSLALRWPRLDRLCRTRPAHWLAAPVARLCDALGLGDSMEAWLRRQRSA